MSLNLIFSKILKIYFYHENLIYNKTFLIFIIRWVDISNFYIGITVIITARWCCDLILFELLPKYNEINELNALIETMGEWNYKLN